MDGPSPIPPATSHPFRWVPEFLQLLRNRTRSQARLLGLSMVVGAGAGLGAVFFVVACQLVDRVGLDGIVGYRPPGPEGEARVEWIPQTTREFNPWLLLVVPMLGGLASGTVIVLLAPEAEGHGTDNVIAAYHLRQGKMRARVPLIKTLASALTLSTGGSGGREGPIAQVGAGIGSFLGTVLRLKAPERRTLLAAGMGAGISAIFRAPLAGALFASEVLYRSPEFEPEVIMPAALASVVAYSTFGVFFGFKSLFSGFRTPGLRYEEPLQLILYTILAVAMAFLALVYTRTFYGTRDLFKRMRIPQIVKPAIGAGLTGVIGFTLYFAFGRSEPSLSVLSYGYNILQEAALRPETLSIGLLFTVALGKIVTTSLTIGSGGSAGVFGPSMVIGGCAGGALGLIFQKLWPHLVPTPASFMIVGMAGFFAAAAKTPFSTLIMVGEITGDYRLLVPTLWVCTISFFLSDEQSIYQSQMPSRALSPAHLGAFVRQVLAGRTVAQVASEAKPAPILQPGDKLDSIVEQFDRESCSVLPVVNASGCLEGVVDLHELFWTASHRGDLVWVLANDIMDTGVMPLTPEDRIEEAVDLFAETDLQALPIVRTRQGREYLGMVERRDIARAYLRHVQGEIRKAEKDG